MPDSNCPLLKGISDVGLGKGKKKRPTMQLRTLPGGSSYWLSRSWGDSCWWHRDGSDISTSSGSFWTSLHGPCSPPSSSWRHSCSRAASHACKELPSVQIRVSQEHTSSTQNCGSDGDDDVGISLTCYFFEDLHSDLKEWRKIFIPGKGFELHVNVMSWSYPPWDICILLVTLKKYSACSSFR